VFHESVQFAALHKLPIVYVCEDNGFSVNTPIAERRASGVRLDEMARAHTLNTATGDGNNALEVHALAHEAVGHARAGKGPSFLLFKTYRWLEHCGPGDDHHLSCRSAEDFALWKSLCPVLTLERALVESGAAVKADLDAERTAVTARVAAAMAAAKAAPSANPAVAGLHVYAEAAN